MILILAIKANFKDTANRERSFFIGKQSIITQDAIYLLEIKKPCSFPKT